MLRGRYCYPYFYGQGHKMLACAKTSRFWVMSTKLRFISTITHPQWKFIRFPCLSEFLEQVPIATSQSSAALPKGMKLVFSMHDGWAVHPKEIRELSHARRKRLVAVKRLRRCLTRSKGDGYLWQYARPTEAPPLEAHKVLLSEPQIWLDPEHWLTLTMLTETFITLAAKPPDLQWGHSVKRWMLMSAWPAEDRLYGEPSDQQAPLWAYS